MAANKSITDEEREFIRAMFPQMNAAKIAAKLGRSRSGVNNIIRAENLREKCARSPRKRDAETGAASSSIERLEELRDMLRVALESAEPREMPGLAREYRATLDAIEKIEGGGEDDATAAFDAIASSIARRMSP